MYLFTKGGRPLSADFAFDAPSGLAHLNEQRTRGLTRATLSVGGAERLRMFLKRHQLVAVADRGDGRTWLPSVLVKASPSELQPYLGVALVAAVEPTAVRGWQRVRLGPGIVDPVATARVLADRLHKKVIADEWVAFEKRSVVLNDARWNDLWHLHPSTTVNVSPDANMRADEAWTTTRGTGTRLAVLDDGIFVDNEDLVPNLIAKMGGGFIMKDFIDDDDDPSPEVGDGHGTRVAGTAAARGDNTIGVSGVCPECAILPGRLFSSGAFDDDALFGPASLAAEAFVWASDNGARVIINSWGPVISRTSPRYEGPPAIVLDAINDLVRKAPDGSPAAIGGAGVLFAWAAGNNTKLVTYDGWASDPRVFAVGASNARAELADYSDFGPPIRLLAPSSNNSGGLPRISTTDNGVSSYTTSFGGTSAAAPVLGGAAALVLSAHPNLSLAQLVEVLEDSADPIDVSNAEYNLEGESCTHGRGRLNVRRALDLATERATSYAAGFTLDFELCGDGIDNDNDPTTPDDTGACLRCVPTQPNDIANNDIDDDCDGFVDNDGPCISNVRSRCGVCESNEDCLSGLQCSPTPNGSFCLGVCSLSEACRSDEVCVSGQCLPARAGVTQQCVDPTRCSSSGPEVCDNQDNDCNGKIDDLLFTSPELQKESEQCRSGTVGVCSAQLAECRKGVWECVSAPTYQPIETLCDNLDNDCNGKVDENDCEPEPTPSNSVRPASGGCSATQDAAASLWMALFVACYVRQSIRVKNNTSL